MKMLLLMLLVAVFSGCTRPESTIELLESEGYTNVETHGYAFFACSQDDWFHTKFSATKNGHIIKGTVCEGIIFKNKTIRYE